MSKVIPIEDLSQLVTGGQSVGLGGAWMANHPMAAVRQLIRDDIRDLHIIGSLSSIDVDLLIGAGVAGELTFSMVSLEAYGLAPNFRKAVQAGTLVIHEVTGVAFNLALDAGARHIPYMPMVGLGGSQIPEVSPDHYAEITCPFTGQELLAVRALVPDVAIIHVLRADAEGNAQVEGPLSVDPELARAAKRVVITCEEIVDTETIAAAPALDAHPRLPGRGGHRGAVRSPSHHPRPALRLRRLGRVRLRGRLRGGRGRRLHRAARRRDRGGVPRARPGRRSPRGPHHGRRAGPHAGDRMSDHRIEELLVCRLAADVDESGVTVLGSFTPLAYAAYMLAKLTHAPGAWLVGFNAIGMPPVQLNLTGSEAAGYRGAVAHWSFSETTNTVHLGQRGLVEYVSPAQMDGTGAFNLAVIGDYEHPKVRMPGGAGSAEVVQNYERIAAYFGKHDKRTLVEKVDFRTGQRAPLSDAARRERGLLAGPVRIVTPAVRHGQGQRGPAVPHRDPHARRERPGGRRQHGLRGRGSRRHRHDGRADARAADDPAREDRPVRHDPLRLHGRAGTQGVSARTSPGGVGSRAGRLGGRRAA